MDVTEIKCEHSYKGVARNGAEQIRHVTAIRSNSGCWVEAAERPFDAIRYKKVGGHGLCYARAFAKWVREPV